MAKKELKPKSKIGQMFEKLSRTRHMWQAWNDVISLIAIMISNTVDKGKVKDEREEEYLTIIKGYTDDEIKIITDVFSEIVLAFESNSEQDLLGDLYMELNLGSNNLGQFFTPYHLCELMSKISFKKELVEKEIEDTGYVSLNEPTCGAGANVIAYVNECKKHDVNYQKYVRIVAQDISRLTALMCYIQLSLLGCDAIIVVGDTLRNPATEETINIGDRNVWYTPIHQLHCYGGV